MSLTKGIDDSDSSSDESDNEIDWASAYAVVAAIVHEHEQERTQEPAGPGRGIPGQRRMAKYTRDFKKSVFYQEHLTPFGIEESRDSSSRLGKLFRIRFRVPYSVFEELVALVKGSTWIAGKRKCGKHAQKLEKTGIYVLSSLRYMAKGFDFHDALASDFLCSGERLRTFYRFFIRLLNRSDVYDRYVHAPENEEQLQKCMKLYEEVGLPGCVASVDGVHVPWERCPTEYRSWFVGKSGFPTIAFNVAVSHSGNIMHVDGPHPGTRNDKTIVKCDKFVMDIKNGTKYADVPWTRFDDAGNVVQDQGLYTIADGGYHRWRCMQCPVKWSNSESTTLWSSWVESIRKDVECVFGRVKGRFRCLKIPSRLQSLEMVSKTFKACCVLHNWILEIYSTDVEDCEFLDGDEVLHIQRTHEDTIVARAQSNTNIQRHVDNTFDASGVGLFQMRLDLNDVVVEHEDSWSILRSRLISHFKYAFRQKLIRWVGC
eukprot:m.74419 g.74419  ORF g.74419 m.74419 type:complete len:485 (-) comp16158_c0_seq21:95-1549(-)